jgi:hypothetical protein
MKSKSIRIEVPKELVELCKLAETTPEFVLTGFMADLLRLPASHGSDERSMAGEYFLRVGRFPFERYPEVEAFLWTDRTEQSVKP